MTSDELDEFWIERFNPLRQEILTSIRSIDAKVEVEIALAIMPFEYSRYRYCRGLTFEGEVGAKIDKTLKWKNDKIKWSQLNDWAAKAKVGNLIQFYTSTELKKLLQINGASVKVPGPKAILQWRAEKPDHDLTWLANVTLDEKKQTVATLHPNVASLLGAKTISRQHVYDALTAVHFPKNGISAPSQQKFAERKETFKLAAHGSFQPNLGIAYLLDGMVFPHQRIAAWPIWSYQPSAWIMVTVNVPDGLLSTVNRKLKKYIPRLETWEREVESELYAFRVSVFHRQMSDAYQLRELGAARKALVNASTKLFHSRGIRFYRFGENGSLSSDDTSVTDKEAVEYPSLNNASNFGFPRLSAYSDGHDGIALPVLHLERSWQDRDIAGSRHRLFLVEQAYRQLLNQSRLLEAVVERNVFSATASLAQFLMGERSAVNGFVEGLREVLRSHERLTAELPLGSERLARLSGWLSAQLDNSNHILFKAIEEGIALFRPQQIEEMLREPSLIQHILGLRQDIREVGRNGLRHHLLLRPLAPGWVGASGYVVRDANPSKLQPAEQLAFTAACLKAWAKGALWYPHLLLLRKACSQYGTASEEQKHINNCWYGLEKNQARYRLLPPKSFDPVMLLGIMQAFADLCVALNVETVRLCDKNLMVILDFKPAADKEGAEQGILSALASPGTGSTYQGNLGSAASRLRPFFHEITLIPSQNGSSCQVALRPTKIELMD